MCSLALARFDKTRTSTVFLKSSTLAVIYCPHWLAWEPRALHCVATLLASREICELGACITMSLKLGDSRLEPGSAYQITWSTLISGFYRDKVILVMVTLFQRQFTCTLVSMQHWAFLCILVRARQHFSYGRGGKVSLDALIVV